MVEELQAKVLQSKEKLVTTIKLNQKSETYITKVQDIYKDLVDEQLQAQMKIDDTVQKCHDEIVYWK